MGIVNIFGVGEVGKMGQIIDKMVGDEMGVGETVTSQ